MIKLFVIHYYPIEYFPPVINLLTTLHNKASLIVVSTQKSNSLTEFSDEHIPVYRPIKEDRKVSSLLRLIKYCFFVSVSLWRLIREKPDVILYYESISALAPYLYKRFWRRSVKVCVHYHEYMTKDEYDRPGMKISKYNHKRETSFLYEHMCWISQTNIKRIELFLKDYPFVTSSVCHILPNYPPQSWYVSEKKHSADNVIRCIYIGSLSLKDTFIAEFCAWVANQNGRILFDIFSFNFHQEVKEFIDSLQSSYISFYAKGIAYPDIPNLLQNYDVGLLLYRANSLNFKYNETNKFYEYLICGLDVWYPKEMTLLREMDKPFFSPRITMLDFNAMEKYSPLIDRMVVDNTNYHYFAESIYLSFGMEVLKK